MSYLVVQFIDNLFVSDKDLHVVLEDEYKIKSFVDDHDYYHFDDTIEISDLKCVAIQLENSGRL